MNYYIYRKSKRAGHDNQFWCGNSLGWLPTFNNADPYSKLSQVAYKAGQLSLSDSSNFELAIIVTVDVTPRITPVSLD